MERFFQILAVILAGIAAYFLWKGNADNAFVSAVFGAVSFFLSVRFQVKGRLRQSELEDEETRRKGEREISEPDLLLEEFDSENRIDDEQRTTDNGQKTSL
jgi:hypothetical protein